jgi:hypothetical protein
MSVTALKSTLSALRAEGNITVEEAKTFTSSHTPGVCTDKDELELISRVAADIAAFQGPVTAEAKAAALIGAPEEKRVTTQNDVKRGAKIGAIVGGAIGGGGAAVGILGAASVLLLGIPLAAAGVSAAASISVFVLPLVLPVLLGSMAVAILSVGIGALAGFIRSKVKTQKD